MSTENNKQQPYINSSGELHINVMPFLWVFLTVAAIYMAISWLLDTSLISLLECKETISETMCMSDIASLPLFTKIQMLVVHLF
ncbi:MAG: hypothetical protein NC311_01205 [Muribaculaceae bacterium]|nr:hypothetical protein [Muribaculaceae bacterium]